MKLTKNEIIGLSILFASSLLRGCITLILERGTIYPVSSFLGTFFGSVIFCVVICYIFNSVKKAIDKKPRTQKELALNNIAYVAIITLVLASGNLIPLFKG